MNNLTKVFLVLLRLAIGWHFLVEGYEKISSVYLGPTQTSKPWTSEPYLREASGPLGEFFRKQAGDPDEEAVAQLTLQPLASGQDPAKTNYAERFPPALAKEWDLYLDYFLKHYEIADPAKVEQARTRLRQAEENTGHWLVAGKRKVKKPFPTGTVEAEETTAQRIGEYKDQLQKVRDMQDKELPAFGQDVLKERLRAAKAELARVRNELMADLAEQTEEMHKALHQDLPKDQAKELLAAPLADRPIKWIDRITMYLIAAVGVSLLLGLFTRTGCVAGALFLLMVYSTMPPIPGVPENLKVEGHYFYVSKNLIEMLALLALATTRSGCWAGLDGLLQFLNPWRANPRPEERVSTEYVRVAQPAHAAK